MTVFCVGIVLAVNGEMVEGRYMSNDCVIIDFRNDGLLRCTPFYLFYILLPLLRSIV